MLLSCVRHVAVGSRVARGGVLARGRHKRVATNEEAAVEQGLGAADEPLEGHDDVDSPLKEGHGAIEPPARRVVRAS